MHRNLLNFCLEICAFSSSIFGVVELYWHRYIHVTTISPVYSRPHDVHLFLLNPVFFLFALHILVDSSAGTRSACVLHCIGFSGIV